MLRESSKLSDADFDLSGLTSSITDDGDIPAARLLVEFTESIVKRDPSSLNPLRDAIVEELGADALVDAAATVAAFHGFVRVADATGIPYTEIFPGTDTTELRAEVGVDEFYAARLGDRG
jgi:hypothetical protein